MYPLRVVLNTRFVQLCKANKTFLHSDIAQMAGKVPVDVNELGLDLASISSHKVRILLIHCRNFFAPTLSSAGVVDHAVRHVSVCQRVHMFITFPSISPALRCTDRRDRARCTSAASPASRWSRCSPAAARSGEFLTASAFCASATSIAA
jgi:hypothetical protein